MPDEIMFRGSSSKIPKDAVRLSDADALQMILKNVQKWKPSSDVWPLKYGTGIMGGLSAITGWYINAKFRQFLKLHQRGRLATYFPLVAMPALATMLTHSLITNDILLLKTPCPVCVEMRAASYQLTTSVIYPMIMAPLLTFYVATSYKTYFIPPLNTNFKDVLHLYKSIVRRTTPVIYFVIAFNVIAATAMTHMQTKSSLKMHMGHLS